MSAEGANSRALRPLSKMELYSSTRHHLGIYRCVIFTCRYSSIPSSSTQDIFPALGRVIAKHPMLRVGILGQDTDAAQFSHVPRVDLRDHVEIRTLDKSEGQEYEQALCDIQAWCHDQLFADADTRPPWRIVVAKPTAQSAFEDVIFAYHHSLMDGTSGKIFHEELLAAFNDVRGSSVSAEPQYILEFPDPPVLPEGQEDVIPFTISALFMARSLWANLAPRFLRPAKPSVWHGKPIDFSHPHKARVLAVDIPADDVASLATACRSHSTTVTALFHALILTSFARRLPASEAPSFASTTPINLRPWLSPNADASLKDSFRVLVSNTAHRFDPSIIGPLRTASATELDALIWQNAQRVKSEIRTRTSTLPADDLVSLMKYIPSWSDFWRDKDGQPRDASWELSSIGTLNLPSSEPRKITRLLFTNGIMVAGAPVGFSAGTVTGGPLTIGISWQEDIVPTELVEAVAKDLSAYARRLRETGKFIG